MFEKDNLLLGLLLGMALPVVGYALTLTIFEQIAAMGDRGAVPVFRPRTLAVIALCFNLIPFNIFRARGWNEAMRGMVFPTALYVIAWIIYFGPEIF